MLGGLLCALMTLLGSLFGVLTASFVKVSLDQNFGGMCGSLPDGIWLRALRGAISEPKPKSLQVSEQKKKEQSSELGVRFLDGLISVRPLAASPNQIGLVGRSPAPWQMADFDRFLKYLCFLFIMTGGLIH